MEIEMDKEKNGKIRPYCEVRIYEETSMKLEEF